MVISKIVNDKSSVENPTENDVINAVNSLNGNDVTIIELFSYGEDHMTLAGGNHGRYLCYLTKGEDEEFLSLLNPDTDWNEKVEIVAGGNIGVFGNKHCQPLETIMKAAQHFAKYGTPHPDLLWDKNSSLF